MSHKRRDQWLFSVVKHGRSYGEAIALLRQDRQTLFGISISNEIQLVLFLIGDIPVMVYVRQTNRPRKRI
jgi:hypothetical protein